MPRTHQPPKYRHHKASGQALVVIDGAHRYLGIYNSEASWRLYHELIAAWLANGRKLPEREPAPAPAPSPAPVLPITVAEVLVLYMEYAEKKYGRRRNYLKTLSHIKRALGPLREHFGALPAESFGPLALEQLRDLYIAEGLSRNTVNDRVRIVKDVFSLAVRKEKVQLSLKHGLNELQGLQADESDAPEPKKVKPVPDAYVDAVLPHVLPPVKAMIEVQRLTGARAGEIVIMRGCDLDTTGPLWIYKPEFHKTQRLGHEREIMLGPKAQEIIKKHLKADTKAYLFDPREAVAEWQMQKREGRRTKVQPSQRDRGRINPKLRPGDRYTVDSYRRAIRRACEKVKVPDEVVKKGEDAVRKWKADRRWHPHQLRHLAASRLKKAYGSEVARIMLGHAHLSTTELYGERDREVALRVAREVG
jgi:integrase